MLDMLYENIGAKIKTLAKWTFVVEAIGTIITGLILLSEELILPGLLTAILGPIMAWISSWVLYAFGELVEKTVNNENNTKAMLHLMTLEQHKQKHAKLQESPAPETEKPAFESPAPTTEPVATKLSTEDGSWVCEICNRKNVIFRTTCWACGWEKK